MSLTDRRIVRTVALNASVFWDDEIAKLATDDDYVGSIDVIITSLAWDPADPLTVTMSTRWQGSGVQYDRDRHFSRDMLNEGMARLVGEGFISIGPDKVSPERWMVITINPNRADRWPNPVPTVEVERFLRETYEVIPLGEEKPREPDWDDLLGGAL